MNPKKMSCNERVQLLLDMGAPVPAHLKPEKADVRSEKVPGEHPLCVKCGGQPNLGRNGSDGKVRSYCWKCAEEEYLGMLSSEERALLR